MKLMRLARSGFQHPRDRRLRGGALVVGLMLLAIGVAPTAPAADTVTYRYTVVVSVDDGTQAWSAPGVPGASATGTVTYDYAGTARSRWSGTWNVTITVDRHTRTAAFGATSGPVLASPARLNGTATGTYAGHWLSDFATAQPNPFSCSYSLQATPSTRSSQGHPFGPTLYGSGLDPATNAVTTLIGGGGSYAKTGLFGFELDSTALGTTATCTGDLASHFSGSTAPVVPSISWPGGFAGIDDCQFRELSGLGRFPIQFPVAKLGDDTITLTTPFRNSSAYTCAPTALPRLVVETSSTSTTQGTYRVELRRVQAAKPEIDWSMPKRLTPAIEEHWGKTNRYGLPPYADVNPKDWKVDLFLTRGGRPVCPDGSTYRWHVSGEGSSEDLPGTGCRVEAVVPRPGVYRVTAAELADGAPTGTVATNGQVVVRDWLIAGLGDSNGSGEGNPPWVFPQCDRSLASAQYRTAQYIEDHDPRSSVTLLFESCSGARSDDLWQDSYAGIQPKLGEPLPPQIKQIEGYRTFDGLRKVDAAIMSVGINDLYFGPLMTFCVLAYARPASETATVSPQCEELGVKAKYGAGGYLTDYYGAPSSKTTLAEATTERLRVLPLKYRALSKPLAQLNPSHVFVTQYPEMAHDQTGAFCTNRSLRFPAFYQGTWEWLSQTGRDLNDAVAATSRLGWIPITGIPADFFKHGYCATGGSSDFVSIREAFGNRNGDGSFHPNAAGQQLTFVRTRDAVCTALYGNPGCDGIPHPPG
jgi:hypothetical protein